VCAAGGDKSRQTLPGPEHPSHPVLEENSVELYLEIAVLEKKKKKERKKKDELPFPKLKTLNVWLKRGQGSMLSLFGARMLFSFFFCWFLSA
jgi:hypothetical protein